MLFWVAQWKSAKFYEMVNFYQLRYFGWLYSVRLNMQHIFHKPQKNHKVVVIYFFLNALYFYHASLSYCKPDTSIYESWLLSSVKLWHIHNDFKIIILNLHCDILLNKYTSPLAYILSHTDRYHASNSGWDKHQDSTRQQSITDKLFVSGCPMPF